MCKHGMQDHLMSDMSMRFFISRHISHRRKVANLLYLFYQGAVEKRQILSGGVKLLKNFPALGSGRARPNHLTIAWKLSGPLKD